MTGAEAGGEGVLLVPLTRELATALLGGSIPPAAPGFPREDDVQAARMVAEHGAATSRFGGYLVVERASGLAIGTAGFFGPPDAGGAVEIGYGLVSGHRGRGLGREVVRGLIDLAFADDEVRTVAAWTTFANEPSRRLLLGAGFTEVAENPAGGDREVGYELARPTGRT